MPNTQTLIPRAEHPRPDFMRDTYQTLNGIWQFAFDDANEGLAARWFAPGCRLPLSITVPFCYQSEMSGIGGDEIHPVLWYRRAFTVPESMQNRRLLLRFGAVDYRCEVFINGSQAGNHTGGYTPFCLDITPYLVDGENDLCVRVEDAPDRSQPRGKQYWERGLFGCWYTPTSGIWQSVYLEAVGEIGLSRIHITPDIDNHQAIIEMTLDRIPSSPLSAELTITMDDNLVRRLTVDVSDRQVRIPVDMLVASPFRQVAVWSPEQPVLYDVSIRLFSGEITHDTVRTYFGMRKVEVKDGYVLLNNQVIYQRLVLDQGYWPKSLLTPPSDDAIREDIEWTKRFGYNGARKHQKIEDPRYYYWADKLGLLVWGEMPSAYDFNGDMVANMADTMLEFINRDFNHPSIIAWVPLNESWGVFNIYKHPRQQSLARALYHLTKAADGTRIISGNDGWEQTETDICALHDYCAEKETLQVHFLTRETVEARGCDHRMCYAAGLVPTGKEAFMVTEYGGVAFDCVGEQGSMGGMETWGYNGKVSDEKTFLSRVKGVTDAIRELPYCQGYCYTQLTDVQQEINGLLTPDRKPKVKPEDFAALNRNPDGRHTQRW